MLHQCSYFTYLETMILSHDNAGESHTCEVFVIVRLHEPLIFYMCFLLLKIYDLKLIKNPHISVSSLFDLVTSTIRCFSCSITRKIFTKFEVDVINCY